MHFSPRKGIRLECHNRINYKAKQQQTASQRILKQQTSPGRIDCENSSKCDPPTKGLYDVWSASVLIISISSSAVIVWLFKETSFDHPQRLLTCAKPNPGLSSTESFVSCISILGRQIIGKDNVIQPIQHIVWLRVIFLSVAGLFW